MIEIYEKIIPSLSFFKYREYILGFDQHTNSIFEINNKMKRVDLKGIIPQMYEQPDAFSKVVPYKDNLFFIPFLNNKVFIYHVTKNSWKELVLDAPKNSGLFLEAFILNDVLYLVPFNYEKIVEIELNSNSIKYIDLHAKCPFPIKKKMFVKYLILDKKTIILPVFSTNIILKYHVDGFCEWTELENKEFQINSITKEKNYIYLASKNSLEILKLNLDLKTVDCWKVLLECGDFGKEYTYFTQYGFEICEKRLYCFPANWNHIIRFHLETGKSEIVKELDFLADVDINTKGMRKFFQGIVCDNKLYIQHYDEKLLIFDLKTEEFRIVSTKDNDLRGIYFKAFLQYIVNK